MTRLIDTSRQACIEVICGSSGSGKSSYVKDKIKGVKRLVVFDPDDEYGEVKNIHTVTKLQDFVNLLKNHPKGAWRVRYVPRAMERKVRENCFDVFCRAAFAWGNCTVVAEELAGVTTASKAVGGWHTLVSRGRKRGISIYAVMQRPAESDKTVMGNATVIHVGRLSRDSDRKYLSREIGVPEDLIFALKPLEYFRRDMMANQIYAGKVGRGKPKVVDLAA